MSVVVPPATITAGAIATISIPNNGGDLTDVVIENISTYLITVGIGPNQTYLAPLTAQQFEVPPSTSNIYCSSTVLSGDTSTSGTLAATFYSSSEDIPGTYPVAITSEAQQIAQAILAAGVPSVSIITPLTRNQILAGGGIVTFPAAQYASLIVLAGANSVLGSARPSLALYVTWFPFAAGLDQWYEFLTAAALPVIGGQAAQSAFGAWSIPANVNVIQIQNNGADPVTISVYGSNRPVQSIQPLGRRALPRNLRATSTAGAAANAVTYLQALDDQTTDSTTDMAGNCQIVVSATTAGNLLMSYTDSTNGTLTTVPFPITAGTNVIQCAHPAATVTWKFQQTPAGVAQCTATFTQD